MSAVVISDDGKGIVTVTSTVPNADGALTLTPTEIAGTGQLTWTCASPGQAIESKYLPANCRTAAAAP